MTRTPYLAGNWKMNLDRRSALELAGALREGVRPDGGREVAVFPSFVYIDEIARALSGSAVRVGPNQFPSIYKIAEHCAKVLTVPIPNVYIVNSPVPNA